MAERLRRHRVTLIGLAVLASIAIAPPASGHDFGPLSINLYSRLEVETDQIRIRWVLDMAEIPADAIVELIDQDANGSASDEEKAAYLGTWTSSVLDQIHLTVDGTELEKAVTATQLDLLTGENGARYLRVALDMSIDLPPASADGQLRASYQDLNYRDYIGWREVVVTAGEGVQLLSSTVSTDDRTNELQTYPPDLGASTPNSEADFSFRLGAAASGPETADAPGIADQPGGRTDDVMAIGLLVLVLVVVVVAVVGGLRTGSTARR